MKTSKIISQPQFWTLTLGLVFVLVHHFVPITSPFLDYLFFLVFVVLIGIPHGAIDHLIEEKSAKHQQKSFSFLHFLAKYLVQMGAYGLLWWVFPGISLLVFLVLSAWHFGESDLQPAPQHSLWKVFQFVLGGLVLFFILMREPVFTGELIYRITRENALAEQFWSWSVAQHLWIYFIAILSLAFIGLFAQQGEPIALKSNKLVMFSALLILLYFMPLLPAFALYFGGWHALNTFGHMGQFLGGNQGQWQLWKAALPFTILAMVFLGIIAMIWSMSYTHIDPLPILFIFIAIITLPHLLVMAKMFSNKAYLDRKI